MIHFNRLRIARFFGVAAPRRTSHPSPAATTSNLRPGARLARAALGLLVVGPLLAGCGDASEGTLDLGVPDLILTGVHVVDVVEGEVLLDRRVAIDDGRIAAVFTADQAPDARASEMMDAGGRYLVPGLWDMHVHFRGGEDLVEENRALLPLYIANGVTTVRDAGGDITPAVLGWRDSIAAGELTGPRILTSGPKLDGPSGGWDGSIRLSEPGEVGAALDSLQRLGVDYVKIYDGTTSREVYLEILEETERRGMIVTGHMPYTVRFEEAVERGLDATEHLYFVFKATATNGDSVTTAIRERAGTDDPLGFWQALSLLIPAHDSARAEQIFQRMAAEGTAALPTLHIMQVLSWVDETDHSDDPQLRYIPPGIRATYEGRVRSARNASASAREERRRLQSLFIDMVRPMHDAGVTILAGSDAGPSNSHVYPGFSLHGELEELVGAGLTPAEALRAATVDAAEFMRLGEEFGRVAPGYRADLVLLDENPLENISHTRGVAAVVLDGRRILDSGDLENLLEAVAQPDG